MARLIEPGAWIDAVRERGGSAYETVSAGVDSRTGLYEMELPDGAWEVRPEGDGLEQLHRSTACRAGPHHLLGRHHMLGGTGVVSGGRR